MKKILLIAVVSVLLYGRADAQFILGNTGLLHMPTADMQADKTVMIGGGSLAPEATPAAWDYRTYNYYFNITILPFLEIDYDLTLFSGESLKKASGSKNHFDKWANQDRNFSARLRLIKEGQFVSWMPQIVVGANDFLHTISTDDETGKRMGFWSSGNGYWGRFFIAATEHFNTWGAGILGAHVTYMYNERQDFLYKGVGAGIDYHLTLESDSFWAKAVNGLDLRAEYDSRAFNIGFSYSFWKEHINFVAEWFECKAFSCGVYFKFTLH